jgi:hypothetical protein
MPLVEDVVWSLTECYSKGTFIAFTVWTDEDVRGKAEEMGLEPLSQDQCEEVLRRADEQHNASEGINWDTIERYIIQVTTEKFLRQY